MTTWSLPGRRFGSSSAAPSSARDGSVCFFTSERVDNPNTHGTGCTLSSAIASNLAKGYSLEDSIQRAKQYIFGALSAMLDLGKGSGPMDHMWDLRGRFAGGEV